MLSRSSSHASSFGCDIQGASKGASLLLYPALSTAVNVENLSSLSSKLSSVYTTMIHSAHSYLLLLPQPPNDPPNRAKPSLHHALNS